MSIVQAILIALVYYLGRSPFLAGPVGYYTIYRPVIGGWVVGIILGDPLTGMAVGATINLMYSRYCPCGFRRNYNRGRPCPGCSHRSHRNDHLAGKNDGKFSFRPCGRQSCGERRSGSRMDRRRTASPAVLVPAHGGSMFPGRLIWLSGSGRNH